jgi:hypothetical protein
MNSAIARHKSCVIAETIKDISGPALRRRRGRDEDIRRGYNIRKELGLLSA